MPLAMRTLMREHRVPAAVRFAVMEYRTLETFERGRTIFESLIASHPKRIDIWSVYVDQEVKAKNIDYAEGILERATSLSLSVKKMKALFKKYLSFQKEHGDSNGVQKVKDLARRYVESQQ
jgi:rRNA biogenesis protein RRP5